MSDQSLPDLPVPSGCAKTVKSAVLHVISLAHFAIVAAGGWAANSLNARVRLSAINAEPRGIERILVGVQQVCASSRLQDSIPGDPGRRSATTRTKDKTP